MLRSTIFLVFFLQLSVGYGAQSPVNSDNDELSDGVERWLLDVDVNMKDSSGASVGLDVDNSYNDTDSDGIPDIIESLLTFTNPTRDDGIVCAGGGEGVAGA
ncbi:MAG: hypothetical protein OEY67_11190, partial [Gammaproteobacteria bacterium]|nr:hypothetical protein [Gammaproteobacteria bacterium]